MKILQIFHWPLVFTKHNFGFFYEISVYFSAGVEEKAIYDREYLGIHCSQSDSWDMIWINKLRCCAFYSHFVLCFFKKKNYISKNKTSFFDNFFVYNFSARLAAAAGAGDNPGLKEEGKKDGISGK